MLSETELTKAGLSKGSVVEVTSDEEGFRGAWYRAVLVETPSKSRRKKLLIRYLTLLKDDGYTLLDETVEPVFIRPLPPSDMVAAAETFEEGDVVDAGYRDGWWTGVVMDILEDGRYVVYFDNPPDVMEFEGKFLRAHLDWIDGQWVRPEKKQLTKSAFSSGTTVEVRAEGEDLHDVWVPAVVIKENEDGTVYVKYKSSRNSDDAESRRIVVDSCDIRPTPLPSKDREYNLLEQVDVRRESGWREGVVTRILAGKTYTVYFKSTKESIDFNESDLRPSVVWKDGMWEVEPKLGIPLPNYPTQSGLGDDDANNSEQVVEAEKSPCAIQNEIKERTPSARLRKKWGDRSSPVSESYAASSAKKMKLTRSAAGAKQLVPVHMLYGGYAAEGQASVSTNRSRKIQNGTPAVQAHHGLTTPREKNTRRARRHASNGDTSIESEALTRKVAAREKHKLTGEPGGKVADAVTNGNTPVRIRQVVAESKEFDSPIVLGIRATLVEETGSKAPKKTFQTIRNQKDSANDSVEEKDKEEKKSSNNSQKRKRGQPHQNARDRKTAGASGDSEAATKDSSNVAEDDQPLSTWIGVNLSTAAEESRLSSARTPNGDNNSAGEKQIGIVETPMKDATIVLPFVKKSPIWNTFESMEVFKIVPQRPHFSPLLETKEEYREGSAVGMMVTFSGLLEKVNNLQFDDPRNTLENIKECLVDIEKHGFDVTAALYRVNELLSMKDKQIQTLDELKQVKREMEEYDNKRHMCEEDIEAITSKILELQKQQADMMKLKESMEIERARLQSHAVTLDQTIQNVEHEFQKTVTSPWKSPQTSR